MDSAFKEGSSRSCGANLDYQSTMKRQHYSDLRSRLGWAQLAYHGATNLASETGLIEMRQEEAPESAGG